MVLGILTSPDRGFSIFLLQPRVRDVILFFS